MQYFHHDFADIQDYLHHRPPYLLVDRIQNISPTAIETALYLTGQEFFFAGHFPGAPIMPGAMMQELATQSAGILIAARYNPMPEFNTRDPNFNTHALGVLVKTKHARFKGFARPGDRLTAIVKLKDHLGDVFDFSAAVSNGQTTIMKIAFQLMNIPSATLRGQRSIAGREVVGRSCK